MPIGRPDYTMHFAEYLDAELKKKYAASKLPVLKTAEDEKRDFLQLFRKDGAVHDGEGLEWVHYDYELMRDHQNEGPKVCGICTIKTYHGWVRTDDADDVVCGCCMVLHEQQKSARQEAAAMQASDLYREYGKGD